MNRVIFRVSMEVFREALGLPLDVRLVAVGGDMLMQAQGSFVVVMEGDWLPEVAEGGMIPEVEPKFVSDLRVSPRMVDLGVKDG